MKHFAAHTATPQPVTDYENREVDGGALACENVFLDRHEKTLALRAQQKAYLESLPTESGEALKAVKNHLLNGYENYPEGFELALHTLDLLDELLKNCDKENPPLKAMAYFAEKAFDGLRATQGKLDRIHDILKNEYRIEREKTSCQRQ